MILLHALAAIFTTMMAQLDSISVGHACHFTPGHGAGNIGTLVCHLHRLAGHVYPG